MSDKKRKIIKMNNNNKGWLGKIFFKMSKVDVTKDLLFILLLILTETKSEVFNLIEVS